MKQKETVETLLLLMMDGLGLGINSQFSGMHLNVWNTVTLNKCDFEMSMFVENKSAVISGTCGEDGTIDIIYTLGENNIVTNVKLQIS